MKKIISALLIAAMLLSMSSCVTIEENAADSKSEEKETTSSNDNEKENDKKENENGDNGEEDEAADASDEKVDASEATAIKAEKISSFSCKGNLSAYAGGYVVSDGSKKAVFSLDGTKQTEFKYTTCNPIGNFFEVSVTGHDVDDISSLNNCGLVDANCNELIPMEYAKIKELNERYVQTIKLTERSADESGLMYYSYYNENDEYSTAYFKGEWKIFDTVTGKFLDGATGTENLSINTYGNYISFKRNGYNAFFNGDGKTVMEGTSFLSDGHFIIDESGDDNNVVGVLYDPDGNKIFEYDPEGFVPCKVTDEYIIAEKYDGGYSYVLMDKEGNTVSGEYSGMPTVCGEVVFAGGYVYDMSGEKIIDKKFEDKVYVNDTFMPLMNLCNGSEYTVVNGKGEVVWNAVDEDSLRGFDYGAFYMHKVDNNYNRTFYCLKDKDYTIEGKELTDMLVVSPSANNKYSVVEMFNGESIISGYTAYKFCKGLDGVCYIAADNSNGTMDIFKLSVY